MALNKEMIRAIIRQSAGIKEGPACPVCITHHLSHITVEGVEQEFCTQCHGIWLDCGEAAELAEGARDFPNFKWSWERRKASKKHSPRHPDDLMWEMPYCEGQELKIDFCARSKGTWLDGGELPQLEKIMADTTSEADRVRALGARLKKAGMIVL